MSTISRFIQGESYPVLKRYNSSNVLQETIELPYVADTDSSYVKQKFIPYPDNEIRQHQLLSGDVKEDSATGFIFEATIQYKTIATELLKDVLNCIIQSKLSGYLKLYPRNDSTANYKVVYLGDINLESKTRWLHNVGLNFRGMEIITSLTLAIPSYEIAE